MLHLHSFLHRKPAPSTGPTKLASLLRLGHSTSSWSASKISTITLSGKWRWLRSMMWVINLEMQQCYFEFYCMISLWCHQKVHGKGEREMESEALAEKKKNRKRLTPNQIAKPKSPTSHSLFPSTLRLKSHSSHSPHSKLKVASWPYFASYIISPLSDRIPILLEWNLVESLYIRMS